MAHNDQHLEAWVDVGGTFTDCYVRGPRLGLRKCKILSSGRVPISLQPHGSRSFLAVELSSDSERFWCGAWLCVLAIDGRELQRLAVQDFSAGVLTLVGELPKLEATWRFELDPGLEAPVLGVRRLLDCGLESNLPPLHVRLGTTKGTNALLTRTGAKTAFAITEPFQDLLVIGDQTRPDLFALSIDKPTPLSAITLGIRERLDAQGNELLPLDLEHARQQFETARRHGCTALAICLLHSYLNPTHEEQLLEVAKQFNFAQISGSSRLAPLIEIVARAQTTLVDAYLSPTVRGYLQRLVAQFGDERRTQLLVMTSAGGLVDWREYSGKDSILSGPAGGVAALRAVATGTQRPALIGLDMGGTSTDVCRVGAGENLQYESTKAGVRILTPTLPIETVASGGGSICWFDGVSLRVGPQSAGAIPGPACYGRGGPLTLTDLNVFLGRVPASQFPFPIDVDAIARRLDELAQETERTIGKLSRAELSSGFRRIASEQMAEAVRTVSIAQGVDPRRHALVGFGGAAGQHICEIADSLGIGSILDSADGGLLSALGMGLADLRLDGVVSVYRTIDDCDWAAIDAEVAQRSEQLAIQLQAQDASKESRTAIVSPAILERQLLELRYRGTDVSLTLECGDRQRIKADFDALHRSRYGYAQPDRGLELVAVRVHRSIRSTHTLPQVHPVGDAKRFLNELPEQAGSCVVLERDQLQPGDIFDGPAIVANSGSTLMVEPCWRAEVLSDGTLELLRMAVDQRAQDDAPVGTGTTAEFDPVFRDCFAQRLAAIAVQMGVVLQQTAISVNVKQRRDFSCAVFDRQGQLLASAPHVPVHLGAMGETVRAILQEFPRINAGDCFVTNDPYRGGSHLPDITVVTPVFGDPHSPTPAFFVANRAHHADVGGISPGSMSVKASRLSEEGVLISPMRIVDAGQNCIERLTDVLRFAKWPPRKLNENLADIAAQQAANERGRQLLADYAATESWDILIQYAEHLLDAAESRMRQFVAQSLEPTVAKSDKLEFCDSLDDGTPLAVSLGFPGQGLIAIDFSGTGGINPANFNANPSIVRAAVMYVLRCLIADDLPLNEGVMRCVRLAIPPGILDPLAAHTAETSSAITDDLPAVAAGNVETSQRIVDVLLGALHAAAASQGTMNNLLFGNSRFGFYETICGGAGATRHCQGASGVHTHMTNTRLTDPEVLEAHYPVRLIEFEIRQASGGSGRFRGGHGVRRTLEFLEDVELSLLTSRRGDNRPFGLDGGGPGAAGINTLLGRDGVERVLPGCCQRSLKAGDRLQLQTPGGGGFGPTSDTTIPKESPI